MREGVRRRKQRIVDEGSNWWNEWQVEKKIKKTVRGRDMEKLQATGIAGKSKGSATDPSHE